MMRKTHLVTLFPFRAKVHYRRQYVSHLVVINYYKPSLISFNCTIRIVFIFVYLLANDSTLLTRRKNFELMSMYPFFQRINFFFHRALPKRIMYNSIKPCGFSTSRTTCAKEKNDCKSLS